MPCSPTAACAAIRASPTRPPTQAPGSDAPSLSTWEATRRYFPALARAAVITVGLSCLSMVLAVIVGVAVASGRVYGPAAVRLPLAGFVEVIRGTPLLLQLFVI